LILALLAQAATPSPVDPQVVEKVAEAVVQTIWTPEFIWAISGLATAVITALGAIVVQLVKIKRGQEQTHDMAVTENTAKLRRLNDMSTRLADATQDPVDIAVSEATEEELRARLEMLAAKGRRKEDPK
jgi:hypothetical protein